MSDPSNATPADGAERIAAGLEALGVRRFDSIDTLLAWEPDIATCASQVTAGLTIRPSIRIQEHHDITPALFVYDPFLGTIGLVEVLPEDALCDSQVEQNSRADASSTKTEARPPRVTESIREFIDRAAYFRQLCLLQAERTETQAHSIELVIVFQRTHPLETKTDAATVLHALSSETGYMRSIGVNLLDEDPDGGFSQLRQTFPWLLTATRKWFGSARMKRDASSSENLPWSIALRNYRIAGGRRYKMVPGRFHLMHGSNGSGKSSLSEALELLLTRSIERLERKEKTRYFSFVRHRPSSTSPAVPAPSTPAKAVLRMSTAQSPIRARVSICPPVPGVEEERRHRWNPLPAALLPMAASFRLDQRLMDFIIQASDGERAALFLKAYFPADQPALKAESDALVAADAAFNSLPQSIRDATAAAKVERAAYLRESLAWIGSGSAWQPRVAGGGMLQMVAPCLPVTPEQLTLLGVVQSPIRERLDRWRTAPATIVHLEEELQKLDQELSAVRPLAPGIRHNLEVALPILRQFNAWRAVRQIAKEGTLRDAVDKWIELQALADLVAKYHDVAATLDHARALGWKPQPEHESIFDGVHEDADRLQSLRQWKEDLAKARDDARTAVRAFTQREQTPSAGAGAVPTGVAAVPLQFIGDQLACLNQVGEWLPSTAGGPGTTPLGQILTSATRENSVHTRGRSTIGIPGGLETAIADAEQLLDACRTLEASTVGAADVYRACASALNAFKVVEEQERAAMVTFFRKLQQKDAEGLALIDALNELLSLFKPAPWAYAGLTLEALKRSGDAPERLALRRAPGDESEAELLLNTAEMNTFTLALFFLCAPGLDNPLKLLVLDDPLQNMDEMTVSSLARGLGKVMRIYPDGWRILALFHGEEDVYRLRDEIRTSVYRLPWVSPATAPAAATTTVEAVAMHGTEHIELQNIGQIVTMRAPAAAVQSG